MRALGADERVLVDYSQGELQAGDVFILLTDGVHGSLPDRKFPALLGNSSPQQASEALAQAALKRSLALRPLHAETRAKLAGVQLRAGQVDEGCKEAMQAASQAPNSVEAMLSEGDCYLARSEREQALSVLRLAAALAPEHRGVQQRLKALAPQKPAR